MAPSRSPSPAGSITSNKSNKSNNRSRSVSPTTATTRLIQQHNSHFAALDSSSEEDNAILRPRGKIASRMQVRGDDDDDDESRESASDVDHDANTTRATTTPRKTSQDGIDAEDDDEEEVVVTTRPRKLTSRREPSSTPQTRPQHAASSPGLFISPQKDAPRSPGLFVSPSKPQSPSADRDDDDLLSPPALTKNHRYKAMLAKKREQRLAREAEEARKKAARQEAAGYNDDEDGLMVGDDEDDNITDDEGGRKLTQEASAARPPRKASKKAIEEMHRETQRLARSLQLAHEAKVKKKITKAALFERFNFKPAGSAAPAQNAVPATSSSRAPTPGSAHQSDAEMKDAETPPSSPPAVGKEGQSEEIPLAPAAETTTNNGSNNSNDDDFPTLEEIVQAASTHKGKGKAIATDLEEAPQPPADPLPQQQKKKRNIRVILPPLPSTNPTVLPVLPVSLDTNNHININDDDDDDLQILPTHKSKIDAIFARAPLAQAKAPLPLLHLRRLAHLDDPDKKPTAPHRPGNKLKKQAQEATMTAGELQAALWRRARAQAKAERDRHLEMLRAKGVHVQTAEEREREMQAVEDIVARERRKAEEIMEREREEGREERRRRRREGAGEDGEDPLGWDESEDDEEYVEEEEEKEVELSGSEEEEEEEGAGELLDDAAAESGEEEEDTEAPEEGVEDGDSDEGLPSSKHVRRGARKQVTLLSDDEDDAEPLVKATPRPKAHFPKSPSVRHPESPSVPTSVLRSATKTFIPGLPVAGPAGLGLTQIFAGTMDDSQMGTAAASPSQPRPTFDVSAFPDSNFSQTAREAADDLILDSQPARETQQAETQGVQIRFSQSQMHGFDSFLQATQTCTQASDLIEPTQDEGFRNFSPLRQRFVEAPASTVDTVAVGSTQEQNESPLVRRTGKLRRKADVVPASPSRRGAAAPANEDEEMEEEPEADEFGFGTVSNNAFAAMKEAALKEKKRKEAFDKKKSKARGMVEEQAEESEDEYAGLGGADGEDSSDDDDHSVKEMIDDETKDDAGDERKLAAFYADRERASDEKQVEKLFHDITTGMLRRKRNGNWDDLSDSDDDGEARRRMKRRQFAKMQRALMADERISKVAENPRNQAFLRTIEDRSSDDDMDFIFAPPPPAPGLESQDSQATAAGPTAVIPNSQPQPAAGPNPRRTKGGKKPANIGEIRESLSNLLDEPFHGSSSSLIPATDPGSSDVEDDNDDDSAAAPRPHSSHSSSDKENRNRNPRRTAARSAHPAIIDRITLKRNASSSVSTTGDKLAFATTTTTSSGSGALAGAGAGSFKVPALLRRATTNSLLSTTSSSSSSSITHTHTNNPGSGSRGGGGASETTMKIKKPAGKRSGVSYLARETERRAAVAEAERRREAKKVRGAEGRVKAVGGLFGAGRFE